MKKKRYTILILGCILVFLGQITGWIKQDKIAQTEPPMALESQHISVPPRNIEEQDRLFKFSQNILEEAFKGKVALVDPRLVTVEEDGYNKYFLKIEGIGINTMQAIDLYHCYFILQKSEQDELYMMPSGLEVLVGQVDNVKEDILISMLKLTNEWEKDTKDR